MDSEQGRKMWSSPLTEKTYRYYAITQFLNPEKTWNAYFKSIKCLDGLVNCISAGTFNEKSLRKAVAFGNGINGSFSKETATRIITALVSSSSYSNAKTLLEWLGLYYDQPIPEADLDKIPWSDELARKLENFKGKKN